MKNYIKVKGNENATHIKYYIDYEKGGANYFSGGVNRRGYYAYVLPVSLSERDGYTLESFALFGSGGGKVFLEEAGRLNKKRLAALQADAATICAPYIAQVLERAGLEIDNDATAAA